MSYRIFTSYVASMDDFINNPNNILNSSKEGIVAIFTDNNPTFYVVTTNRLEQLLKMESYLSLPATDVMLEDQLYEESLNPSLSVPIGKFLMYSGWNPDKDFYRMSAIWGIPIIPPVTSEELAKFIDYWKAEKKVFHHIQWQQKLARSIQVSRTTNNSWKNQNSVSVTFETNNQIPPGFRG